MLNRQFFLNKLFVKFLWQTLSASLMFDDNLYYFRRLTYPIVNMQEIITVWQVRYIQLYCTAAFDCCLPHLASKHAVETNVVIKNWRFIFSSSFIFNFHIQNVIYRIGPSRDRASIRNVNNNLFINTSTIVTGRWGKENMPFIPPINLDKMIVWILPYQIITFRTERPSRSRLRIKRWRHRGRYAIKLISVTNRVVFSIYPTR